MQSRMPDGYEVDDFKPSSDLPHDTEDVHCDGGEDGGEDDVL